MTFTSLDLKKGFLFMSFSSTLVQKIKKRTCISSFQVKEKTCQAHLALKGRLRQKSEISFVLLRDTVNEEFYILWFWKTSKRKIWSFSIWKMLILETENFPIFLPEMVKFDLSFFRNLIFCLSIYDLEQTKRFRNRNMLKF